jgi:TatD DNase family protein
MTIERAVTRGFDFHCHVDLFPDPPEVVLSCDKHSIVTVAVTTTPRAWQQNRKWTSNSRCVYPAVGLHPELVGDRFAEVDLLERLMQDTRLVGEIGLDGSPRYQPSWKSQVEVFVRALRRAESLGQRVLSVHSRRSASEVVSLLGQHTTKQRTLPILHWFSGTKAVALRAIEVGCYFSVNSRMLESDTGASLVRSLPTDRLLTETDAPFASAKDKVWSPAHTRDTIEKLAVLTGHALPRFTAILSENAERVFSFAGVRLPM